MKFLGYKQVRVASIHVDAADIRKRTKAAHVSELAANIRELGEELIHAPLVRADTKTLLCGRDRMAALILLKAKKVWIHLVECDDREAEELEIAENAYRRQEDRTALIAKIAGLREAYWKTTRPDASIQEVRALANKDAARISGVGVQRVKDAKAQVKASFTSASLAKAERRARDLDAEESSAALSASGESSTAPAAEAEEPAPTLDRLGIDDASVRAVEKFARQDQEAIDAADQLLRQAQTALSRMAPSDVAQDLKAQVHRVASLVRSARPAAICPWCKGLPKATVSGCLPCLGVGYVPAEKAERAPKELREGPPLVAIDGVFMPYEDVRDGRLPAKNGKPAKAAKPGKHVTTILPDGHEFVPDEDEAY